MKNPGKTYRILRSDEVLRYGDEYWCDVRRRWCDTHDAGYLARGLTYRRKRVRRRKTPSH